MINLELEGQLMFAKSPSHIQKKKGRISDFIAKMKHIHDGVVCCSKIIIQNFKCFQCIWTIMLSFRRLKAKYNCNAELKGGNKHSLVTKKTNC